jgi:hypothetical protein
MNHLSETPHITIDNIQFELTRDDLEEAGGAHPRSMFSPSKWKISR